MGAHTHLVLVEFDEPVGHSLLCVWDFRCRVASSERGREAGENRGGEEEKQREGKGDHSLLTE